MTTVTHNLTVLPFPTNVLLGNEEPFILPIGSLGYKALPPGAYAARRVADTMSFAHGAMTPRVLFGALVGTLSTGFRIYPPYQTAINPVGPLVGAYRLPLPGIEIPIKVPTSFLNYAGYPPKYVFARGPISTRLGFSLNLPVPIVRLIMPCISLAYNVPVCSWKRIINYSVSPTAIITYRCLLTGDQDGLNDLIIPISSFQARRRNLTPTYLEAVIPGALEYINDIAERQNGHIIIEMVIEIPGKSIEYQELVRVQFNDFAFDLGARNGSARISGTRVAIYTEPKSVALSGVSYLALQKNGLRRIRCDFNFFTDPGDLLTWDNGSMTAGLITMSVGTHQKQMEISELST